MAKLVFGTVEKPIALLLSGAETCDRLLATCIDNEQLDGQFWRMFAQHVAAAIRRDYHMGVGRHAGRRRNWRRKLINGRWVRRKG